MSEWWTYGLSDFLLFSPRTYYRMIERHNEAVWPAQILALGLGLGIAGLLRRPAPRQGRLVSGVVAALWTWVAWAFFWNRYAGINWAANYFGWLFALEALILTGIGVIRGGPGFRPSRDAAGITGMGLLAVSLVVYPLIAPLLGRGWRQAEVFGVAPDPTVIGTLGLLLLAPGRSRWALIPAPLLWCALSGATLWAMGSAEAGVLALAALLALSVLRGGGSSSYK